MKPTVALIGRPNVGKSTLFNRLTRSRAALVADFPGLTRDRHYGHGRVGERPFLVVDTGGLEPKPEEAILHQMARQTRQAIAEADAVIFITDVREGLTVSDQLIAKELRTQGCRVVLAVNKAEGMPSDIAEADFFELGLGKPYAISAAHGDGIHGLIEAALGGFEHAEEEPRTERHPKIAVVGRPNVGKSTLINRFLGEERVIAFDEPGTTRDSIYIDFARKGKKYTLIDTAGIRRKGRTFEAIEKFSVIKTLQAIEDSNVTVLVLDATQDISEQDAHIAGFILEAGRAVVVAINKWDAPDEYTRQLIKRDIARKLKFLQFTSMHFVSGLHGAGMEPLFDAIDQAYRSAMIKLSTPKLTKELHAATTQHQPPQRGPFRPRLKYAHQGGMNPPIIVVHGTAIKHIAPGYKRYLENYFRKSFDIFGTPLRVEFRQGHNPYDSRD